MSAIFDFILHLDVHLNALIDSLGVWMYVLLFLVIFCETGLVITPFLPGDSLLFALGAVCALGNLQVLVLIPLLMIAANTGDFVNYFIGNKLGHRIVDHPSKLFNKQSLHRTHAFYEKHGGKTIIFARFIPIVRTFAPFVAGLGTMGFRRFAIFSIGGGAAWVSSFILLGYFFGNQEIVKKNFALVVLAIIVISVLPAIVEFIRHRKQQPQT